MYEKVRGLYCIEAGDSNKYQFYYLALHLESRHTIYYNDYIVVIIIYLLSFILLFKSFIFQNIKFYIYTFLFHLRRVVMG